MPRDHKGRFMGDLCYDDDDELKLLRDNNAGRDCIEFDRNPPTGKATSNSSG